MHYLLACTSIAEHFTIPTCWINDFSTSFLFTNLHLPQAPHEVRRTLTQMFIVAKRRYYFSHWLTLGKHSLSSILHPVLLIHQWSTRSLAHSVSMRICSSQHEGEGFRDAPPRWWPWQRCRVMMSCSLCSAGCWVNTWPQSDAEEPTGPESTAPPGPMITRRGMDQKYLKCFNGSVPLKSLERTQTWCF